MSSTNDFGTPEKMPLLTWLLPRSENLHQWLYNGWRCLYKWLNDFTVGAKFQHFIYCVSIFAQFRNKIFDPGAFTRAVEDGNIDLFLILLNALEGMTGPAAGPFDEENPVQEEGNSLQALNDAVFGDGMPLLHFLCSIQDIDKTFIKALLHKNIDINLSCPQHGRPIHIVCSRNCPENLKVLLEYGAKILEAGEQAWEENSPFYVSSLCGHFEIISILFSYQPRLIREQDVRSCLLYAACAGGNKDIVSKWYCPGMDINQPKPYIQSLDNSGDNTPIFAACAGGHFEVVQLLVEMGARLTHRVCTDFPVITGRILSECVQQATSEDILDSDVTKIIHVADYKKIQLRAFHGDWLRVYTETLVSINISENCLEELPREIPWSFPNLQRFNASHNSLVHLTCGSARPVCQCLKWIQLSHNELETVCTELFQIAGLEELYLSHNKLQYLVREHQFIFSRVSVSEDVSSVSPKSRDWSCDKLTRLVVSHNQLKMLPGAIKQCSGLVALDASHNCMTAFCGGWDCNLGHLNLSFNELERFPEDIEMFWCGSLQFLNLDHNQLEFLAGSIVKLCALTDLIVSNNRLSMLPKPEMWDCPQLYLLNLYGNQLGQAQGLSPGAPGTRFRPRLQRIPSASATRIVLPKFLCYCLHDLNLGDNHLDCVPEGICHLSLLTNLNLSKNPGIKILPDEMGGLTSLTSLHLEETSVKHMCVQSDDLYQWTKDKILNLQHQFRKCKPYNKIKLVILGKKDKGKTTLAGLLRGNKMATFHGTGIHRWEMKLGASGISLLKRSPEITLSVWDMACSDQYIPAQQCFFTKNSLYILVWDIWSLDTELDLLGHWLYSIEARTPNSRVILVTTFLDKNKHLTDAQRDEKVSRILSLVIERYGPGSSRSSLCSELDLNNIIPVSCTTKEGIPLLKQKLFEIVSNMYDPVKGSSIGKLLNRKVPLSYLSVEKAIEQKLALKLSQGDPPFMEEEEFQELIRSIPNNDITTEDDITAVTQFLVETGSLLHYSDQLRGLSTLYILDPSWLCDLLAKVLTDDYNGIDGQIGRDGKISVADVTKRYMDDPSFPDEYIGQYLQLLERFEIALSVDDGRRLFIPGRLSQSPALQLHSQEYSGTNVYRLYQMAFIPTGFWSRLLSRIMARLQLLEQPNWKFQSSMLGAKQTGTRTVGQSRMQHTVIGRQFSGHLNGLHIKKKDMIYWQDGICMRHTTGYFKLETIRIPQRRERPSKMGILVVVHSTVDEFSILGTIVDEIDDLLTDHYPGLLEWDNSGEPRVQRYALCQRCYDDISTSSLPPDYDHFTVEHCARVIRTDDTMLCKTGSLIPLEQLVPELLVKEIPQEYHLDQTNLEVQLDAILGRGVSGSVFKGRYGNIDVAVKYYHGMPTGLQSSGIDSMDSGKASWPKGMANNSSEKTSSDFQDEANPYGNYKDLREITTLDTDEANSLKAWKSFMEMRQEVAVTSKLQHPCVISFIGICVKPKLLMCLEFAALGSLRNVLDAEKVNRKPFNKHRDRDKVFRMILSKDLTYKMVFQIATGLDYLHKHGIIYRDLKSDNILVTTLDLTAPVNLKLSDYGISKFYSSGGTLGMVGTPGYQAPEIMDAQFYDEKVDIFSFAMVIYEVVSGERPYGDLRNIGQITTAIKQEGKRPSLKSFNLDTRFPQLEQLMEKCWRDKGTDRPSTMDIVDGDHLRSVQFLCKHKIFDKCHGEIDLITPVTDGEKRLVWIWEGTDTDRSYTIVDMTTCMYHEKKPLAGPTVTCMCKVDQEVWLGTDVGSDEGMVEVWKQLTSGQLQRQITFACDGIPTNIIYLKGSRKTGNKLYVTLHNGKLRTYTMTLPSNQDSLQTEVSESGWSCQRNSQQISDKEACCAVHVMSCNGEELWVGCGPDIVVYSVATSMVENRIHIGKMLQEYVCDYTSCLSVQMLVQGDGRVWCLMCDTAFIVELDTDMGIATHIYSCDLDNPHSMNMAKKMPMDILEKVGKDEDTEDDDEDSSGSSLSIDIDFRPKVPPRRSPSNTVEGPPQRPPRPRLTSIPAFPKKNTVPDKKGGTLPSMSRRYSLSNIVINSICIVGDTIWISRNRGDILIICTLNYESFKKGEVIAILNCRNDHYQVKGKVETVQESQTGHCVVESLLCVNDLVVTVIRDNLTRSHLVGWEAYSCTNIANIRRYWKVRAREEMVKRKSRLQKLQIPSQISEGNS
ncbi:leucine-rich repeat serine/threonine-protein kinase 1-like [Ylistrum balloti]|uniref:leucine-rich repeat serine/threonine-protein kinase 1-like n=1 Tax=Ylistrum balloti TaxID=509963 RepID=UPI002905B478|nr:leucine-rich repeat serine/threonine-protein kinase 1-like [Ylistrum balloti]